MFDIDREKENGARERERERDFVVKLRNMNGSERYEKFFSRFNFFFFIIK
jgi:hypothetical protein